MGTSIRIESLRCSTRASRHSHLRRWDLAPTLTMAQGGTSTASLSGKISDATGATLPGVTVTVTSLATNQQRTVVTNEDGIYRFAGLTPGSYSLTTDLDGFAKFIQSDIRLQVGAAADLNVTMRLAGVNESLTVTGRAAILRAQEPICPR